MAHIERGEAIARIKAALKRRSAQRWSVTGGKGTAWSWIDVQAPPARRDNMGYTGGKDRTELANLFGVEVGHQGLSISQADREAMVLAVEAAGEVVA